MNKQDRGGVRTAQDLERKYNFSGMKRAIKQSEEGINKANNILESFVNSTLKSDTNIQSQTDGEITTWFSHGEPTLASEPAIHWVTDEQKEAHVSDLYYDRDTGYAYEFVLSDDGYKWGIITDSETIEALAMANAFYDTEDNKRRVFVAEPYPPYDNGDLWFDGEEIYICQISKSALNEETGEAEVYVEGDFIIATKYTDDTIAKQVGDELQVLQGTVLTVIEDANQFKAEVYDKDEKTTAAINLINESLRTLIKGSDGESLMIQTENGWEFNIGSLLNTVDGMSSILSYMKLYEVDGEPYLELGTSKNGFRSVHSNKGIEFIIGDTVAASIDYDALNIQRAVIHDELQIGGFLLKERDNGNVGFVWRGEDN